MVVFCFQKISLIPQESSDSSDENEIAESVQNNEAALKQSGKVLIEEIPEEGTCKRTDTRPTEIKSNQSTTPHNSLKKKAKRKTKRKK